VLVVVGWRYPLSGVDYDARFEEVVVDKFNSLETHCLGLIYHFSGSVQYTAHANVLIGKEYIQ
jgi:hypothetical protein